MGSAFLMPYDPKECPRMTTNRFHTTDLEEARYLLAMRLMKLAAATASRPWARSTR